MKIVISVLVVVVLAVVFWVSREDHAGQDIDDWLTQSARLFQGSGSVFAPEQPKGSHQSDEPMETALENLLPSDELNLRYNPDFDSTVNLSAAAPDTNVSYSLLPDLFEDKPKVKRVTSVGGQVFRDENDKIIGAEVRLAIPADI